MERVTCFGDSNTYGYDPRSFGGGRYPESVRWTSLLSNLSGRTVLNLGENGREIPVREPELRQAEPLICQGGSAALLLIMLGSNDLLQHPDSSAEWVAGRMEGFLQHLLSLPTPKNGRPSLLLLSPPPLAQGAWVTQERTLRESTRLGFFYGTLAGKLRIWFLDTGPWRIPLAFDGVHFSPEGHRLFAQRLWGALNHGPYDVPPAGM